MIQEEDDMKRTAVNIKRLALVVVALVVAAGCAGWLQKPGPSICDKIAAEGRQSYLCGMRDASGGVLTPERADFLLRVSVALLLEKKPGEADEIIKIADEGIGLLTSGRPVTYVDAARWAKIKVGPLVSVVVGEAVDQMMVITVPILPDDRAMLVYHLERVRELARLAGK